MATVNRGTWAQSLLASLEVPVTPTNIQIISGWEEKEGGAGPQFNVAGNIAAYNPLNTTQKMPKSGSTPASTDTPGNHPPVQAYNSWSQGLQATVITLTQDSYGYPAIINLLQRGDATPTQAANAIASSKWGTGITDLASLISCTSGTVTGGLTIPTVQPGGVAGLGGTGTPSNPSSSNTTLDSPWYVGDSTNPDQDYWTTINQWAQEAQLYLFSDGETLYVADGVQLMAQTPALVIARTDPRVLSLNLTYDNTSWMFAVTHRHKAGVRRRASLSRTTTPTQATLKVVCDIDDYRGGDVILLVDAGPGDGLWLVGDCTRSAFDPFSTLTLVKGAMPLSSQTSESIGPNLAPAKTAGKIGSGTRISAIMAAATVISKQALPYVWDGGHLRCGQPSTGAPGAGYNGISQGYDCSGAVAAVLAAAGLGYQFGQQVGDNDTIISILRDAGDLQSGQGSGPVQVTLFNEPGVHIYMRIAVGGTTKYFAAQQPGVPVGFYNGSVLPGFNAYHIPANTLREYITGSNAQLEDS